MAVKSCSLRINIHNHEEDRRGTPMFPVGAYITSVGGSMMERIPWHWHNEVEVLYISKGALKLEVPHCTMILKEGDGAFINAKVLQTATSADNGICKIKSFVFDAQLIFGSLESAIEQKYVRPLLNCTGIDAVHFKNDTLWHKDAIHCIKEAFRCYEEEMFGYELYIRDFLSKIWMLIITNMRKELEKGQLPVNTEAARVKEMIRYIQTHYVESVLLKDIADSAAVSERECLRCFNKVLGTTPMQYLLSYRISAAAGLLTSSDMTVTEIGQASGFASPSYFSLKFKALMELTPSQYRQRYGM